MAQTQGALQQVYNRQNKPFPELKAVRTAPYFAADGRLIDQEGYDPGTQTLLESGNLDVPRVSAEPSAEEVGEAKRLIVDETLTDFPFDDPENDDDERPSLAHTVALILQPFIRDMIDGQTPIYAVTKPTPGTGGGLLIEVCSMIPCGAPAAAQSLPTKDEELSKTLTAIVKEGADHCFFDNIDSDAASGVLASAVTAPTFKARLLGSSKMVIAPIRFVWVLVANNIKGSSEILCRCVGIELDAKMSNPELRDEDEFHHPDLKGWVSGNRGRLIWACLTLIQNWIAKGMVPYNEQPMGSFESWSRVMGGILRDAGIGGFLGNRERLRSYAAISADDGVQTLMNALAKHKKGTAFRPGGTSKVRGIKDTPVVSVMDVLNESGEDGGPLTIDGWGYSSDGGKYLRSANIAKQFRDAARRPWLCHVEEGTGKASKIVEYEVSFDERPDPQSPKQYYWVMTKTPKPDQQT